jgi:hypothetical protein
MRFAFAPVVVVGLIALAATAVRSDEEADKAAKDKAAIEALEAKLPAATSASLRRFLFEKVEIPDAFRSAPVPLKIVLGYLSERAAQRGESLQIMIDKQAFKDAAPDSADLLDAPIEFSAFVRSMTYRQVLELTLSQLPGDATYLVREGYVVIVTAAVARIDRLLERRVAIEFRNKPLIAAIEDLSERTGLDIAVDSRCDDGNKKVVTLQTEKGMTVRGILESIADMNDLKIVVTAHRVTVLPHSIYLKRLGDQVQEAKLRREIGNDPAAVEGPRLEPAPNRGQ